MKLRISSILGWMVMAAWAVTAGCLSSAAADSATSRNPIVRVVTISQAELIRDKNDLLEPTLERLNRAASFHPDIACLPELFSNRPAEPVPGPVTERMAGWAREHSSYVIFGLQTQRGGRVYNSAILIDRQGRIVGQYDKIHPTDGEIKGGTTPGDESGPPVFQTDFGTIGIQICFDVNWREEWLHLKQRGAQIVFWPSAYPAERQIPALALVNEFYVVSSTMRGASHIYDITGQDLASSGAYQPWAGAALPLGKRLFETDYNAKKVPDIEQKYGSRVQVVWYHDSDWLTVASLDPTLTMEDLIAEYGLIPLDAYIQQSSKLIDQTRARAEGKAAAAK